MKILKSVFGSITDYEYQLPAGWSIGANTSNGTNWIPGQSTVNVTSDISSDDGADIRIRASNKSCGPGLYANGPISTVRISRPAPTFTITPSGNQAYICSGTKNFNLDALPSGAVVTSWESSDASLATVPIGFTGTTVPVTKVGGEGSVIITANITHCNYTYSVPITISLGVDVNAVYSVTSDYISTNNNQFQYFSNLPQAIGYAYQPANKNVLFVTYINTTFLTSSPTWSVSGTYNLFYPYSSSASLYMTTPNSGYYSGNIANIRMVANSVCGIVDKTYTFQAIVNSYSYNMKVSPNPTNGNINLSLEKVIEGNVNSIQQLSSSKENLLIVNKTVFRLYDVNTNSLIKEWSYSETESSNYNLNVLGIKSG